MQWQMTPPLQREDLSGSRGGLTTIPTRERGLIIGDRSQSVPRLLLDRVGEEPIYTSTPVPQTFTATVVRERGARGALRSYHRTFILMGYPAHLLGFNALERGSEQSNLRILLRVHPPKSVHVRRNLTSGIRWHR